MKCVVDILIEHNGGIRKGDGKGVARIWAEDGEKRVEREQPVIVHVKDETVNALAIKIVNAALLCFKKSGTEIEVRMDVPYVMANIQYLQAWHDNDYKNAKGKPPANVEEWKKLWIATRLYKLSFRRPDETV